MLIVAKAIYCNRFSTEVEFIGFILIEINLIYSDWNNNQTIQFVDCLLAELINSSQFQIQGFTNFSEVSNFN